MFSEIVYVEPGLRTTIKCSVMINDCGSCDLG